VGGHHSIIHTLHQIAASLRMETSERTRRTALFVADALEMVKHTALLKKHGISDSRVVSRLVGRLHAHYTLLPAPRLGVLTECTKKAKADAAFNALPARL
jgi:hypothetical protein